MTIKHTWAAGAGFFAVCMVFLAGTAACAEPDLKGVWQGILHQTPTSPAGPDYAVIITIKSLKNAKIKYPALKCGGKLSLEKSDDSGAIFREKLSGGTCISGGSIEIKVTGKDTASYNWIDPDKARGLSCVGTIKRSPAGTSAED